MIRKWLERGKVGKGEHDIVEYDSTLRQIVSEIFFGNFDVPSQPVGNVTPSPFNISYSPGEIAATMSKGCHIEEGKKTPEEIERLYQEEKQRVNDAVCRDLGIFALEQSV